MNSMQAREEMPIHRFPLQIFRFQALYNPCPTGRLIWQSCRAFRKIGSLYAPLKPTYPLEKKIFPSGMESFVRPMLVLRAYFSYLYSLLLQCVDVTEVSKGVCCFILNRLAVLILHARMQFPFIPTRQRISEVKAFLSLPSAQTSSSSSSSSSPTCNLISWGLLTLIGNRYVNKKKRCQPRCHCSSATFPEIKSGAQGPLLLPVVKRLEHPSVESCRLSWYK